MNYSFDHVHLAPGQQSPAHTQNHFELAYVITGSGERILGDRCAPFAPGDLVLVPPGLRHQWRFDPADTDAEGCIENICLHFSRPFLSKLSELFPALSDPLLDLQACSQAILFEGAARDGLIADLQQMDREEGPGTVAALVSILVRLSQGGETLGVTRLPDTGTPQKLMERLRVFISCNYSREVTLSGAARHVGMNRTAFCRFFKRMTGQTFIEHLTAFRIERAEEMLSTSTYTISEIAAACGFESLPHFSRTFRRLTGRPPRAFRSGGSGPAAE